MSNLEELIEKLCPDGVEYVKLNTICSIYDGTHSTPNYTDAGVKFASVENINAPYDTKKFIALEDYQKYKIKPQVDDVLMTRIGSIGVCYVIEDNQPLAYYVSLALLRPSSKRINSKYLKYVIESVHGKKELRKRTLVNAVPIKINKDDIGKIKLPVPPLEVQREIVRILDNFTFLTTELAAELAARQKQYEFYRDFLLNFNDGCEEEINGNVRLMKLGELGKWSGGKTPSMAEKSFWENGSIPWISSKDMKFNTLLDTQDHITQKALIEASMTLYPANSIAVVTRSGILKHTFPVAYIPFPTTINQDIKILVVNDEILPRYAFHVIQSKGKDILEKTKKQGGTVDSLDFQKVLAFKVLVPTKSIQQKLVDKLDRFDALCNDISSGLPAEIEMRQKQYEYYRDKLLTFKELKKEV